MPASKIPRPKGAMAEKPDAVVLTSLKSEKRLILM